MNNLRRKVGNKRNGKMETKGTLQKREKGWGCEIMNYDRRNFKGEFDFW